MRRLLPIFFAIALFALPLASFAAPLVPCDGPDCQACHVVELGQNIVTFLIQIASFIAVLVFAYGGFLMVTAAGNTGQVSKAKEMFTDALVGILIVLSGWLVIDTVMKWAFQGLTEGEEGSELYEATKGFGPWNQINCVAQPKFAREGDAPGAVVVGTPQQGQVTDDVARTSLTNAGVTIVSSGNCSDPSIKTCTSLQGMRQDTVDQVLALKSACATCSVVVTGGTEAGHASGATSHNQGYKVDIGAHDAALNAYLTSNLTRSGTRSGAHGGARYLDSCGNEYVRESTHWDITVTGGRCSI